MKSYSIHRDHQRTSPLQAVPQQATTTEKKGFVLKEHRKTILALIALAISGYLLVKLQKPETNLQVAATVAAPAGKVTVSKPQKNQIETNKKNKPKEIEKATTSIKAEVSWRKNLIGETVLTGTLSNTASIANFKDPVILVTWLSKKNDILGETSYPLYESIAAGKTVSYKLKVKVPFKYNDISLSVKSATTVQ